MKNRRGGGVLSWLFVAHGVVTLAAGIVLFVVPSAIPSAVDVLVEPGAYLLCYMLGAAEIAIAVLSFGAARLADSQALRLVVVVLVVFHLATAAGEVYAFVGGVGGGIWVNVVVRVAVAALFASYGLNRVHPRTTV